jgi:hypothetical protein
MSTRWQTDTVNAEPVDTASTRSPGDVIVLADVVGTFAFVVTALTAAIVFSTASQWVGAITAMSLFAIGVFSFLWSFYNAVQRSREEEISVTQVYLLLGTPTPSRVRRIMLSMLVIQTVVGVRPFGGRGRFPGHVPRGRRAGPDVRDRAQRVVVRVPRCLPAAARWRHIGRPDRPE